MVVSRLLALGCVLGLSACAVTKPVGQDEDTEGGSGTAGDATTTADGDVPTDAGDGGTTGSPALCPDNPGTCPFSECETGFACGGPLSTFDADGCPRPSCGIDPCDEGRTCVTVGDYGGCAASSWTCTIEDDGTCGCGGTADCSGDVSICVPDEVAPDPEDMIPTLEEFTAQCLAAETQEECAAIPSVDETNDQNAMWCGWETWTPVALGEGDVCEFGTPVSACGIGTASESGCPSEFAGCDNGEAAARNGADGLEVTPDGSCTNPELWCVFTDGEVVSGPPECACICDAGFPG